jgi:hypothetical protein
MSLFSADVYLSALYQAAVVRIVEVGQGNADGTWLYALYLGFPVTSVYT